MENNNFFYGCLILSLSIILSSFFITNNYIANDNLNITIDNIEDFSIPQTLYGDYSPIGTITPRTISDRFLDTSTNRLYFSNGLTNLDWRSEQYENYIYVKSYDDLPELNVNLEHEVIGNTVLFFENEIETNYSIRIQNGSYVQIWSSQEVEHPLIYNGNKSAIVCDNLQNLEMPRFKISAPYGNIFNISSQIAGSIFSANSYIHENSLSGGIIHNLTIVVMNFGGFQIWYNGYTFNDCEIIKLTNGAVSEGNNINGSVAFTFLGNSSLVQINSFTNIIGINETLFNFDIDNPTYPFIAQNVEVVGNPTITIGTGKIFADGSADYSTIKYNFNSNGEIQDSSTEGHISFNDNTIDTIITTQNTYTKININTTLCSCSERFIMDYAGRLTHTGIKKTKNHLEISLSAEGQAVNRDFKIAVFKNPTINADDELITGTFVVSQKVTFGRIFTTTILHHPIESDTDDYYEVFVMNLDSTQDLTVNDLSFGIY